MSEGTTARAIAVDPTTMLAAAGITEIGADELLALVAPVERRQRALLHLRTVPIAPWDEDTVDV